MVDEAVLLLEAGVDFEKGPFVPDGHIMSISKVAEVNLTSPPI